MMDTTNYIEELLELSPLLAGIGNRNVYAVPDGYFNSLPNEITALATADDFLQTNISNPFKVPSGYFDGLANSILLKIKAENENEVFAELNEIAPLLNTISKKNIYTVPPSYFESFTPQVKEEKPARAKVFSMAYKTRKRFSYAAAAAVAGILLAGIFFDKHNNQPAATNPSAGINKIDVKENIADLSDAEIADYLDTHSSGDEIITSPDGAAKDAINIEHTLNNASDDEIQQYLDSSRISSEKSAKGI